MDEAIGVVAQTYHHDVPLPQAISNCRRNKAPADKPLTVAKFLQIVGVMDENDISLISESCLDNSAILVKFLEVQKADNLFVINSAARLKYLIKNSVLTLDAACYVFHHCMGQRLDVDVFLKQAGWYQPTEPGSNVFVAHNGVLAIV